MEETAIKGYIEIFEAFKKNTENVGEKIFHQKTFLHKKCAFDFCFNYFQKFYREGRIKELADEVNIQSSCTQLAMFLVNWGMYRGSSFIPKYSIFIYKKLINEIVKDEWMNLWEIDVPVYDKPGNIALIKDFGKRIEKIFKESTNDNSNVTDTLKSKIMLGIFGNVPALDSFFIKAFKIYYLLENKKKISVKLDIDTLNNIYEFYKKHDKFIDKEIFTKNFYDESDSKNIEYTKAKIIDMIFFTKGKEIASITKEKNQLMVLE